MMTYKKWKTTSKKNGRRPKKKWKTTSKKMEDDLNKIIKDDLNNKMEDEPINQNQPHWL
jgi:hypothetical protein